MRWVESAPIRPGRCAVLPYIGSSNSQKGFIDTDAEMLGFDNHVYISVIAVEQMAELIGWQPPHALQTLQAMVAGRDTRIGELETELEQANRRLGAVEVLKAAGFSQAKRPGRPRKEKVNG